MRSQVTVPGLTGAEVINFLSECTDTRYEKWWHLHLYPLAAGGVGHVGDEVFMDGFTGARHLRMTAVVVDAETDRKTLWQLKNGVRLPPRLTIEVGH